MSQRFDKVLSYATPSPTLRHIRRAALALLVWSAITMPIGLIVVGISLYALTRLLYSGVDPIATDLGAVLPFLAGASGLTILGVLARTSGLQLRRGQPCSLSGFIFVTIIAEGFVYPCTGLAIVWAFSASWAFDAPLDDFLDKLVVCGSLATFSAGLLLTHILLYRARAALTSAPISPAPPAPPENPLATPLSASSAPHSPDAST